MRFKGTLAEWNDGRGFGFIEPTGGGERVFCHVSALQDRSVRPAVRQTVTYELGRDERGRARARQVRYPGSAAPRSAAGRSSGGSTSSPPRAATNPRPSTGRAVPGASTFLVVLAGLVAMGRVPWILLAWYLAASVVTFLLYGWDKTAAEGGHRRTPEATLNAFALLGGWPGAWIAQQAFRHKTRKQSFQVGFGLAVVMNVAALGWLVATGGTLQIF